MLGLTHTFLSAVSENSVGLTTTFLLFSQTCQRLYDMYCQDKIKHKRGQATYVSRFGKILLSALSLGHFSIDNITLCFFKGNLNLF